MQELKLQRHLLDRVETKIERNATQLQSVNAKLTHMLDEAGGACLWCQRIFCTVLLVALVVYLVQTLSHR